MFPILREITKIMSKEYSYYFKTLYGKGKMIRVETPSKASNVKVFVNGLRLCFDYEYYLDVTDNILWIHLKDKEMDAGTTIIVDYHL